MAGTIPLSMTQQFDEFGKPLSGGLLYIMQSGTVATPQNPFQDYALTIVMPNPIILDAAGRIPQFFLADGFVKIRLTDYQGVTQIARDGVLVIGASASGTGPAPPVDTSVMQTGDLKVRYDIAKVDGFVRANGGSLGNSSSSATELGDTTLASALYNYLYNKDLTLAVSGGRTGNSANDFAAGKRLSLPDFRGMAIAGLDGMGNGLAGILTLPYAGLGVVGWDGDKLGTIAGLENLTLALSQLPSGITAANPSQTINMDVSVSAGGGTYQLPRSTQPITGFNPSSGSGGIHYLPDAGNAGAAWDSIASLSGGGSKINTINVTGNFSPNSQPHRTVGPRKLVTIYIKL